MICAKSLNEQDELRVRTRTVALSHSSALLTSLNLLAFYVSGSLSHFSHDVNPKTLTPLSVLLWPCSSLSLSPFHMLLTTQQHRSKSCRCVRGKNNVRESPTEDGGSFRWTTKNIRLLKSYWSNPRNLTRLRDRCYPVSFSTSPPPISSISKVEKGAKLIDLESVFIWLWAAEIAFWCGTKELFYLFLQALHYNNIFFGISSLFSQPEVPWGLFFFLNSFHPRLENVTIGDGFSQADKVPSNSQSVPEA